MASPLVTLSPGDLIRAARACRTKKDWSCAADKYQKLTEAYPGRTEAVTVLVPLAQIELDHLGRAKRALKHFRAYLSKKPAGPLAEEARYGTCRALRALGKKRAAQKALEQFLSLHPSSIYAPNARAMLREISP